MLGLDGKLTEWRRAGLITDDQAAAIRAHEARGAGGIAVWQEALGYLGGTLALSAGAILLGEYWDALTVTGQLIVFGVLAVVLTMIGASVPADREAALRRLSSLLLAAGTAATAWLVGFGASELTAWSEAAAGLAGGAAAVAHGLATWRTRVAPLQQGVTFAGLWVMVATAAVLADVTPEPFLAGLLVAVGGVIWGLLTWGGVIRPRVTGWLLAGAALGVGLQVASVDELRTSALIIAVVATLGVLAAGAALEELVLLTLGAAGILLFVPQLVFALFADTVGAPLALLVTGVALTGGAVASIRMGRDVLDADGGDGDPAAGGGAA